MKPAIHNESYAHAKKLMSSMLMAVVFVGMFAAPDAALAQSAFGDAEDKVEGVFKGLNSLLNIASIAVVTVAVIFAGYQIAFAHKRIADVAPVLIGGFLIGAAAQIAKMLLGDNAAISTGEGGGTTGMLLHVLPLLYA
jgi:type IV secretion system protein VirB2